MKIDVYLLYSIELTGYSNPETKDFLNELEKNEIVHFSEYNENDDISYLFTFPFTYAGLSSVLSYVSDVLNKGPHNDGYPVQVIVYIK